MNEISENGLNYFTFEDQVLRQTLHGIFTRRGGVSPSPWCSLNQGGTVGDARKNVIENRRRVFEVFNRPVESIFDVWQVHDTEIICTKMARGLDEKHQKADAIFTNNPDISLFMRFADCVPILIHDPVKKVVGIIHAGWQGTVKKIVLKAMEEIVFQYGCNPSDISAGIGPSIGPDHYEIRDEVNKIMKNEFPQEYETIVINRGNRFYLDLWKTNEYLLREAGVKIIELSNLCTACNLEDWYSHRAEGGVTGRFGAFIALEK